jgi:LuxR family transcriptional regulator, quorum-sensing system regulator BjaR1
MFENQAFEIAEKFRGAKQVDTVKSVFGAAITTLGGTAYIICDIPPGAPPEAHHIHMSGWNTQWFKKYVDLNYAADDPVPNFVNNTVDPYYWRDASKHMQGNGRALNIMQEARSEFRMADGFCVPLHGLRGVAGVVSIATETENWTLSDREHALLHFVGIYAYEAMRRLRIGSAGGGSQIRLSPRELECIKWIAEGKTNWEVSVILGIAHDTANQYLKSAAQKLNTRSKAHLVARAHRMNLIN